MKQKQQIIVLVVLVVFAALVWMFEWRQKAPALQTASFIQDYKPLGEDDPRIRLDAIGRAQETEYRNSGRNPFSANAPRPPESPNKPKPLVVPSGPALPDVPKESTTAQIPSNLKYFGYGTVPNGTPRRAFVTDGDDVFIVSEGGTLLGLYRILKVGNSSLEIQEISSGRPGAMPLDEQATPPVA
jgi:hypothetical protein